ncbi:MAG: restriction endonuclease subunit S, partial [Clostridia bacterium]
CYVVSAADRFYFQDGMISWLSQFSDNVSAKYIAHLFAMPGFQKQIDSLQAGSTVAYLSIAMLKRLRVILPPVELQSQFITFVAQVDKSKFCSERGSQVLQNAVKCMWNVYMGGRVYDKL